MPNRKTFVQQQPKPEEYPILYPIWGDKWAAAGDGWAVHGDTPEDAKEKYRLAEIRRQEILALPPYRLRGEQ